MGIRLLLCVLLGLVYPEVSGFMIRNKQLGKCLQAQQGRTGLGRVSLGQCSLNSPLQEWHWTSESQALSNPHTGECLTASGEQYEGVHLKPCIARAENEQTDLGEVEKDTEAGSQAWSCSKKGHLTLQGKGLHLSATKESMLVYLSKEHKQPGSRWRTLTNQTVCSERELNHRHHYLGTSLQPAVSLSDISITHGQPQQIKGGIGLNATEMDTFTKSSLLFFGTKPPSDPTMIFFSTDYGLGWKISMLVLTSLALVLGTVILILSVYFNRRKKVVCVLKSYTPREEFSVPGSPMPSERAPLTKNAMRLPHSSPSGQRGEILIEWKDGTVTPLYEG